LERDQRHVTWRKERNLEILSNNGSNTVNIVARAGREFGDEN